MCILAQPTQLEAPECILASSHDHGTTTAVTILSGTRTGHLRLRMYQNGILDWPCTLHSPTVSDVDDGPFRLTQSARRWSSQRGSGEAHGRT